MKDMDVKYGHSLQTTWNLEVKGQVGRACPASLDKPQFETPSFPH